MVSAWRGLLSFQKGRSLLPAGLKQLQLAVNTRPYTHANTKNSLEVATGQPRWGLAGCGRSAGLAS
jgi:hypothetical protein